MLLQSLTFEDKRTGWKLEDLRLDRFNLLVGASGVGKTKILRAIETVQHIGWGGDLQGLTAIKFEIRFEDGERNYCWRLDTAQHDEPAGDPEARSPSSRSSALLILEESLEQDDNRLVDRKGEDFLFSNQKLPVLNRSESAIKLLDVPFIQALRTSFERLIFSEEPGPYRFAPYNIVSDEYVDLIIKEVSDFGDKSLLGTERGPAVNKAFFLQILFPDEFQAIRQEFIDIFPTVEDIAIEQSIVTHPGAQKGLGVSRRLSLKIKERGVADWIGEQGVSSGMMRTFTQLVNLRLAPPGTVVLVDEFENSLGVNCMGPVMDLFRSRANDLQFIITSHHPYIINNVPKEYWKVVQRKGSTVRVTPASDIRALQGASALEAFTRLINSREYEEGIS